MKKETGREIYLNEERDLLRSIFTRYSVSLAVIDDIEKNTIAKIEIIDDLKTDMMNEEINELKTLWANRDEFSKNMNCVGLTI